MKFFFTEFSCTRMPSVIFSNERTCYVMVSYHSVDLTLMKMILIMCRVTWMKLLMPGESKWNESRCKLQCIYIAYITWRCLIFQFELHFTRYLKKTATCIILYNLKKLKQVFKIFGTLIFYRHVSLHLKLYLLTVLCGLSR